MYTPWYLTPGPTYIRTYISGFVVQVAVAKDGTEVFDACLGRVVLILIELPLDRAHIHGSLNDLEIVLYTDKTLWYQKYQDVIKLGQTSKDTHTLGTGNSTNVVLKAKLLQRGFMYDITAYAVTGMWGNQYNREPFPYTHERETAICIIHSECVTNIIMFK